jgi:phosphoglycolate phosphatase
VPAHPDLPLRQPPGGIPGPALPRRPVRTPGTTADLHDTLVLFDWNGTVTDDTERAVRATNTVLGERGLPPLTGGAFRTGWKLPLRDFLRGLGAADPDHAEQRWNQAMAAEPAPARPDAHELLTTLRARGARLGVISAAGHDAVSADLQRTGLAGLFDVVTTGCAAKTAALKRERPTRSAAFYVGDTEYDIFCARAAGYRAIGLTGGYRPAEALRRARPDALITRLGELPDAIAACRTTPLSRVGGQP